VTAAREGPWIGTCSALGMTRPEVHVMQRRHSRKRGSESHGALTVQRLPTQAHFQNSLERTSLCVVRMTANGLEMPVSRRSAPQENHTRSTTPHSNSTKSKSFQIVPPCPPCSKIPQYRAPAPASPRAHAPASEASAIGRRYHQDRPHHLRRPVIMFLI